MDFSDTESGIDYYEAFVGSSTFTQDIVQPGKYDNELIEIFLPENLIMDGHRYYFGVKVRNYWSRYRYLDLAYLEYAYHEVKI